MAVERSDRSAADLVRKLPYYSVWNLSSSEDWETDACGQTKEAWPAQTERVRAYRRRPILQMQPERNTLEPPLGLRCRGVVDDGPGEQGSGAVGGAERDGDRAVDSVLLLAARERPGGGHTRTRNQPQQPPVSDRAPELQWRAPVAFSDPTQFSDPVQ